MKKSIWILILASLFTCANAQSVQHGAQKYDWQKCLNDKTSDCKNHCQTSEDTDCAHNCEQMASDKCKTLGLTPPT